MYALVRDLMHTGIHTCSKDTLIGQVAVLLSKYKVHAIMVADDDGAPIGVITDFDLMVGEWLSGDMTSLEAMRQMTAGELMTSPVASIEADVPASVAAQRLGRETYRRLLVTENGVPTGIISISDFLPFFAHTAPRRGVVADVMSHTMLVCREDTPVSAVAAGLVNARYRSVLVLDQHGKPQGIISGLDFLDVFEMEDNNKLVAKDIMHQMLTISPNATLQEAADMIIQNHHHRLVVVDENDPTGIPIGVLSTVNIIAAMARPDSVWQQ